MDVRGSIDIAAPAHRVWPLLIDSESVKRWSVMLKDFRYADERRGPGARVHVVERAPVSTFEIDFEATDWVEDRSLKLHMTSGSGVRAYDQEWSLSDTPSGCRVAFGEHVELPYGPLGRLLGFAGRRSSERHVGEMLSRLKELAES